MSGWTIPTHGPFIQATHQSLPPDVLVREPLVDLVHREVQETARLDGCVRTVRLLLDDGLSVPGDPPDLGERRAA